MIAMPRYSPFRLLCSLYFVDDCTLSTTDLLNIAEALIIWIDNSTLNSTLLSTIVDYTLYQLSSNNVSVRAKYLHIATLLPVDCLHRYV